MVRQATKPQCELGEAKRPSRISSEVEGRREGLVVFSPELVGVGGEERGERRVEEVAEGGVAAFAKELGEGTSLEWGGLSKKLKAYEPELFVSARFDRRQLEL